MGSKRIDEPTASFTRIGVSWAFITSLLAGALIAAGSALAAPGASNRVVGKTIDRATIDWTLGIIVATGEAAADIRAPSPGIARVKAERQAREKAHERLKRMVQTVPVGSRTVAWHERADKRVTERVQKAIADANDESIDYSSDGSVVLTAQISLERLRHAVRKTTPPANISPPPDDTTSAVIIDASAVLDTPILDLRIETGTGRLSGRTVFHHSMTRARADKRAGERVLTVTATSVRVPETRRSSRSSLVLDAERGARWLTRGKRAGDDAKVKLEQVDRAIQRGALIIVVLSKGT